MFHGFCALPEYWVLPWGAIDLFLGIVSLGPVVFIVAGVALIQGLLTGLHITDHHGLLNLLRGSLK
jgi:hypothetical protein